MWIYLILIIVACVSALTLYVWYSMSAEKSLYGLNDESRYLMGRVCNHLNSSWDAMGQLVEQMQPYSATSYRRLQQQIEQLKSAQVSTPESVSMQMAALNEARQRVDAAVREHPELNASDEYRSAVGTLEKREKRMKEAAKAYNACVERLNKLVGNWPSSSVARRNNLFKKKQMNLALGTK